MAQSPKLLVITDLDGTLLDHHNYSFQAAAPALERLESLGIPVILNTSKTAAELAPLRAQLNNHAPYVVENGAALFWPPDVDLHQAMDEHHSGAAPGYRMQAFGANRAQILSALAQIRRDTGLKLEGFADWDVPTLMDLTGLDGDSAAQALDRQFSEPLLWQGSNADLKTLRRAVEGYGLKLLMGGRFLHVVGHSDKGCCLAPLRQAYAHHWAMEGGELPKVIALGDGDNDVAMLELADLPVLVRSPVNPPPSLSDATRAVTQVTERCGPEGWNDTINLLLDQYRLP
ncbi:HAD-IIB family hydrolase [Ferrimonas sp. YFM]|uniref:HAD-IIB family hydrolase n=1 Tax=Ferrimonas sp. YFM TaxID=3028878 RepID=UPI002573E302|nr:HAD-IIB family hydrolase [Ferrimonas sp. YFM]BDY05755.1 mannosyl-3-phosphoglycerate phosphatase [Ferrimonas sp. YFM]